MFRAITPGFIKRIDTFLLTHHPVLWTSKIHFALWHGLILWLLSALVGFLMPVNLHGRIDYELWYFLFTVIGLIVLCFWIYHYQIFNKEKNYGHKRMGDEYGNFLLVFFTVALFLMIAWPFEIIYNYRIANSYTDTEIIDDINTLNVNHPYMAGTSQVYHMWNDSSSQEQFITLKKLSAHGNGFFTPYYIRQDTIRFPQLLSDYKLYTAYKPEYESGPVKEKVKAFLSVSEKYRIKIKRAPEEIVSEYIKYLSKPYVPVNEFYNARSYNSQEYYTLITVFENICRAKFSTLFIFRPDALWSLFYFVFSISLLLLIFRINYWRQFLITLVVIVLYPLLLLIITELIYFNGFSRDGFYQASLLLLMLAGLLSGIRTISERRHFLPFFNVLNQVGYLSLSFLPLLLLNFLNDTTNLFHKSDLYPFYSDEYNVTLRSPEIIYNEQLTSYLYYYWQAEFQKWLLIAKTGGILLFVILLPFSKELFVRQISLPRKT